jgi:hypothetical protein
MTTICWDGKNLAVDRGCWNGNMVTAGDKIHLFNGDRLRRPEFPAGAWASMGDRAYIYATVAWLRYPSADRPVLAKPDELDESMGLWVTDEGDCYQFTKRLVLTPVSSYPIGLGAGGFFAMGAMVAGKTAREAVLLAAIHTDGSAFGVDTWTPGDPRTH